MTTKPFFFSLLVTFGTSPLFGAATIESAPPSEGTGAKAEEASSASPHPRELMDEAKAQLIQEVQQYAEIRRESDRVYPPATIGGKELRFSASVPLFFDLDIYPEGSVRVFLVRHHKNPEEIHDVYTVIIMSSSGGKKDYSLSRTEILKHGDSEKSIPAEESGRA